MGRHSAIAPDPLLEPLPDLRFDQLADPLQDQLPQPVDEFGVSSSPVPAAAWEPETYSEPLPAWEPQVSAEALPAWRPEPTADALPAWQPETYVEVLPVWHEALVDAFPVPVPEPDPVRERALVPEPDPAPEPTAETGGWPTLDEVIGLVPPTRRFVAPDLRPTVDATPHSRRDRRHANEGGSGAGRRVVLGGVAALALAGCTAAVDKAVEQIGGASSRRGGRSAARPAAAAPAGGAVVAQPAVAMTPEAREARRQVRRRVAGQPSAAGGPADQDASYVAGAAPADPPAAAPAPAPAPGRVLEGPAAAAAAATPAASLLSAERPELHLLRRAAFGTRPATLADIERLGIDQWLAEQLDPAMPDAEGDAAWALFPLAGASIADVRAGVDQFSWDAMYQAVQGTLARQLFSRRQLFEVVVDVLANHVNVPLPNDSGWDGGPSYHQDVVRANAFGRYEDMLLASIRHPAMLRYLSNDQSRKESVNENLGRELLELHTVGIDGGYTEDDVRNSAYVLTGRTVDKEGQFTYDAGRHYTGAVTVLAWSSENADAGAGLEVGDDYLRYLATHESTARKLSRALAVRFVSDDPPAELVDRMTATYLAEGTAIVPVLVTMFSSTEFWSAVGAKVRRPLEDVVGSLRAVDAQPGEDTRKAVEDVYWALNELGHAPLGWLPPNGYPDVAAAWSSAGGLLGRWNRHRAAVQGWWKGFATPAPAALAGAPATYGALIDALSVRLTGQVLGPDHRTVLLTFLEKADGDPVTPQEVADRTPHLAPLVLDSLYFELR